MQLSLKTLATLKSGKESDIPARGIFSLPEKVLQFGTGILLRGLPDYCIDQANRRGHFNGRIVVVKSTGTGGTDAFHEQNGLYTLCVRGIVQNTIMEENIINASISRVLDARSEWDKVLQFATSPDLQIVLSNTTEVGISLTEESIQRHPPESFPAKLLAVLHTRFLAFEGHPGKGLVIIPTELISDNGKKLQEIILQLAIYNSLGQSFADWILNHNYFCNSLVDRIVPGKLPYHEQTRTELACGYTDSLMIMCEPYYLWAIEVQQQYIKEILSFHEGQRGIVLAQDITRYKELKLRLLNGSHTFTCALALGMGFATVKEAMQHEVFQAFMNKLMYEEIVPAITGDLITETEALNFARSVQDRYRNPYLEHAWSSIATQYTSKMRMRNVPLLVAYVGRMQRVPVAMASGFAAYILLMKSESLANTDQFASVVAGWGKQYEGLAWIKAILSDTALWDIDLSALPGFPEAVWNRVQRLQHDSADISL